MSSILTSDRGKLMLTYLPWYYEEARTMHAILQGQGKEVDLLRAAIQAVTDQAFVRTATWGLDRWEWELALVPRPSDTLDDRRQRILAALSWQAISNLPTLTELLRKYTASHLGQAIQQHAKYAFLTRVDWADVTDWHGLFDMVDLYKPAHLLHVLDARVVTEIKPGNVLHIDMTQRTVGNFWSRYGTRYRWDGAFKWDGTAKWGDGILTTQQHQVKMYVVQRAATQPSAARQTWDGAFRWDGHRTWGQFLRTSNSGHHSVVLEQFAGGVSQGRTTL